MGICVEQNALSRREAPTESVLGINKSPTYLQTAGPYAGRRGGKEGAKSSRCFGATAGFWFCGCRSRLSVPRS